MAKQTSLYLPTGFNNAGVSFVNADGTTFKTVATAGANDSVVKMLQCTSNDTAAVNMQVAVYDGTNRYVIGTVNIPIGAGSNGTANAIDLLNNTAIPGLPVDANGKRIVTLKTGWFLQVAPIAVVTAAKTVYVASSQEDY